MSKKQVIEVGAVFGTLKVLGSAPSRSGHAYWLLTCELCESSQVVRGYLLRKGLAQCSCTDTTDTADTVSTVVSVSADGPSLLGLSEHISIHSHELARLRKDLETLQTLSQALQNQVTELRAGPPLEKPAAQPQPAFQKLPTPEPTPEPKPKRRPWAELEADARLLISQQTPKDVVRPVLKRMQDITDLDPFDEAKRATMIELNRYLTT